MIVWGKNDPAFIAPGAEAYLRDLPHAELHLLDAGHFAVEEKASEVMKVADIVAFMELGRVVWMGPRDEADEERLAAAYLGNIG